MSWNNVIPAWLLETSLNNKGNEMNEPLNITQVDGDLVVTAETIRTIDPTRRVISETDGEEVGYTQDGEGQTATEFEPA